MQQAFNVSAGEEREKEQQSPSSPGKGNDGNTNSIQQHTLQEEMTIRGGKLGHRLLSTSLICRVMWRPEIFSSCEISLSASSLILELPTSCWKGEFWS